MSTGGHFEYNIGYRRPGETSITACYVEPMFDKAHAVERLRRLEKRGGHRYYDHESKGDITVPAFLIHRFIPPWTESTNGEFSQEQP